MSDAPPSPHADRAEKPVKFRPYPKVVFLWPIAATALLITLGAWVWPGGFLVEQVDVGLLEPASSLHAPVSDYNIRTGHILKSAWGNIFFIMFAINMLVLAYDFDVAKGVALALGIAALVLLVLWLNSEMGIIKPLKEFLLRVKITTNIQFMWAVSIIGLCMTFLIWIHARFNWWELTHNELIHKKRFLGDTKRYPAINLRMAKEIPDVLELFTFFGCGKLIFNAPGENQAIVLEHVPFVNRREREIKEKLGSLSIRHEYPDYAPDSGI